MEPIIRVDYLSCKMGQSYLLKDITWQVLPGQNWVVYGLNGSGKTTLLSIIAGYKSYSQGDLEIFGQRYTNDNVLALRRRIGWVSGSFYDKYYSRESVLDIILSGKFGTLSIGYDLTLEDVALAQALTQELGIGDKLEHSFDMLSKGERQNVMIARALFAGPELLVLDEPCSGLDVYNRAHLFASIRQLAQQQGLTIIYVTHYTEEIIDVFDHALLLRKGRVFAQGPTQEMLTSANLENFLGHPVTLLPEADGTQKLTVDAPTQLHQLMPRRDHLC